MSTTPYTDAITANPLASVATLFPLAKAQYNCNPPSTWGSNANAMACLDAIYFLLDNRAEGQGEVGFHLQYEQYESRKKTLEARLGVLASPAAGRKRRVTASFAGTDRIG